MTDNLIASPLQGVDHVKVFADIMESGISAIELNQLMMYIIDVTSSVALPYLAEQFDLLGYKGWRLAINEDQQRDLLKKAVELHKYKGTPYAIKNALVTIGYGVPEITEGIGTLPSTNVYDGSFAYDGSVYYTDPSDPLFNWAIFSVVLDLGDSKGLSPSQLSLILALIDEYKNVRSYLAGVSFKSSLSEVIDTNENLSLTITDTLNNVTEIEL
jgi:P2-related tail formation protein